MKWIIFLLILFYVFSGCQNVEKRTEDKFLNPLSLEQVQTIEKNLPKLKIGMSDSEVYATLGVDIKHIGAESGGPTARHWLLYQLRSGYNLLITFDCSDKTTPKFVEAKLIETPKQ